MNRFTRGVGALLAILALALFTSAFASSHAPPAGLSAVTASVVTLAPVSHNVAVPVTALPALTAAHYLDAEPSTGAVPRDRVERSLLVRRGLLQRRDRRPPSQS